MLLSAWASIRHLQLKVEVVSAAQRDSIGGKASWEKARHSAAAKGLVADTDSPCLVAFMAGNKVIQQDRALQASAIAHEQLPTPFPARKPVTLLGSLLEMKLHRVVHLCRKSF